MASGKIVKVATTAPALEATRVQIMGPLELGENQATMPLGQWTKVRQITTGDEARSERCRLRNG